MVEMLIKKAYENIDKYKAYCCTVSGHLIPCECRGVSSESHKCNYDSVVIVMIHLHRSGSIEFKAAKSPTLGGIGRNIKYTTYQISKWEAEKLFERCTAITFNDDLD